LGAKANKLPLTDPNPLIAVGTKMGQLAKRMKKNISVINLALGALCIISGFDFYSSGWSFKYQQPISKIGAIVLIVFGIVLLIIELAKSFKLR
jgi:membrane protein YdbS with pleckstrin-like domain